MFKKEREESAFEWTMLGQIDLGRPNLGFKTDVAVYRLMQFTLRDVLIRQYGVEAADKVFYDAGETAGKHFYENLITKCHRADQKRPLAGGIGQPGLKSPDLR